MFTNEKKSGAPTIYDVAREAGVSYSTVSRTLTGYAFVKLSTREKVLRAAEKLGYVPNQQARGLAGGRSNMIGVLVPALNNSYITEILRGIDEALSDSDYNLLLYTTHRRRGKESTYAATITNSGADGLLLVVPLIPASYLATLRDQNFPYVLVDQSDPNAGSASINTTNWQGAYDATAYLIELGHRRIAFVSGLAGLASTAERLHGFQDALADHGLPLEDTLIVEGGFTEQGGFDAAQALLDQSDIPTAIFAANDLSATGVIDAIRQRGLRVPQEVSVIGFDDIPQASLVYPKLTTVRQPLDQMGRKAVALLLEQIEQRGADKRQLTLETSLVIRDSCAPPLQRNR
ncbi:MAG: LacI family transcriptional regulator [Chloroflexi bacterium]|nr:LacI family transcriptional regulator [Chloroflexota bacterium]